MIDNKIILLTGGTGSFGQGFTKVVLEKYKPKALRIYSRDELKQWEMKRRFNSDSRLRFFIGDVRDKERLDRAMDGVDIVVHAAALKQVPSCEYNPFEAIKTNIFGAQNVIDTAMDHNVEKVIAISTDKAVNPINLYGATKMCMEKLFVSANSYVGGKRLTRMSCVRYGNVIGSRGSVIPLFKQQGIEGQVTITDERMTRFLITLSQGVGFVTKCINLMRGGEIFVPKLPSMKIVDLAKAITPGCRIKFVGIRPGEKINECLIAEGESRNTIEFEDFFLIMPVYSWWTESKFDGGKKIPEGFKYTSDGNTAWMTIDELKELIEEL